MYSIIWSGWVVLIYYHLVLYEVKYIVLILCDWFKELEMGKMEIDVDTLLVLTVKQGETQKTHILSQFVPIVTRKTFEK